MRETWNDASNDSTNCCLSDRSSLCAAKTPAIIDFEAVAIRWSASRPVSVVVAIAPKFVRADETFIGSMLDADAKSCTICRTASMPTNDSVLSVCAASCRLVSTAPYTMEASMPCSAGIGVSAGEALCGSGEPPVVAPLRRFIGVNNGPVPDVCMFVEICFRPKLEKYFLDENIFQV